MRTVKDLISLWPTLTALAEDVGEADGTVRQWARRESIPARAWARVCNAAKRRSIKGVSPEVLAAIHDDVPTPERKSARS